MDVGAGDGEVRVRGGEDDDFGWKGGEGVEVVDEFVVAEVDGALEVVMCIMLATVVMERVCEVKGIGLELGSRAESRARVAVARERVWDKGYTVWYSQTIFKA